MPKGPVAAVRSTRGRADIVSELPAFGRARPGGEVKTLRETCLRAAGPGKRNGAHLIITFTEADYGKKRVT